MRIFRLICLFFLFGNRLAAQSPMFFETVYGTENSDFTRGIVQTSDSSLFVAGFVQNALTAKTDYTLQRLDASGNLIWRRQYGDSLLSENAQGILIGLDGQLVVWGEQEVASGSINGFVSRIDTSGAILSTVLVAPASGNLSLHAGAQLLDSTLVFVGYSSAGSFNEVLIFHCNQQLVMIQQFTESWSYNSYAQGVVALADSGFAVVADRSNGADYDVWVSRYDRNGNVFWANTYGDTLQNGSQGIISTGDGNLVVFGETEISNFSPFDFFIQKIDLYGNSMWRTTSGGAAADAAFSLLEVWNGFIGTGYSNSFAPGPISVVVFRTDAAGSLLWAHEYGGPSIDIGYHIIPSRNNGFYITGNTQVGSDVECYLLHSDQEGWVSVADEEKVNNKSISVFPNPASGRFSVRAESGTITGVQLFNIQGQLIFNEDFAATTVDIETTTPPGIYTLVVTTSSEVVHTKLVIE